MDSIIINGLLKFNSKLGQFLNDNKTFNVNRFGRVLSQYRGEIISSMALSKINKKNLRSSLNSWILFIRKKADEIRNSPTVRSGQLKKNIFHGPTIKSFEVDYILIEDEEGFEHIHMIVNHLDEKTLARIGMRILKIEDNENIIGASIFDLNSQKLEFEDASTLLKKAFSYHKTLEGPPKIEKIECEIQTVDIEEVEGPVVEKEDKQKTFDYIGKIENSAGRDFEYNNKGEFIHGFFYTNVPDLRLRHGFYFIAEKDNLKLVLQFEKGKSGKNIISGQEQSFQEMRTPVLFKVLRKIEYNDRGIIIYNGLCTRGDYSDFKIRYISKTDYPLLNFPTQGTFLGHLENSPTERLPLYQPDTFEYESAFVSGMMHSGKTNTLMYLIGAYTSKDSPAAIVVFDTEGEYSKLTKAMPADIEDILLENGINLGFPLEVERKIISTHDNGNATIPLREIGSLNIPTLIPPLPAKSLETFMILQERALKELKAEGNIKLGPLMEKIGEYSYSQIPNVQIRGAILRACRSINYDIFDQPGREPITAKSLCEPGGITIIDISNLHKIHRRIAILAIVSMLNNYKEMVRTHQDGLLVFIDEAHNIFPANRKGQIKKEDIEKIGSVLDYICHQGRKRKYGLILATQSLNDINSEVSSLCNTQIIMNNSGLVPSWLKQRLCGLHTSVINNLTTGTAYVIFPGLNSPQKITIPQVVE